MGRFLPFISSLFSRKQKPNLNLHTSLSGSVQVWKWVVVGAYNRPLHRRIIGRRALQDHGGNAPPCKLQEGRSSGGGWERPSRETRQHQSECVRLSLPPPGLQRVKAAWNQVQHSIMPFTRNRLLKRDQVKEFSWKKNNSKISSSSVWMSSFVSTIYIKLHYNAREIKINKYWQQ